MREREGERERAARRKDGGRCCWAERTRDEGLGCRERRVSEKRTSGEDRRRGRAREAMMR